MTAKQEISAHGPETYHVAGPVSGGQLVVPSGSDIDVAGDSATNVLGVAVADADLLSNQNTSGTSVTAVIDRPDVAVAYRGVYRLTYSAAASFGVRLVAAASGQVRPLDTAGGDTLDMIVGICVESAGISSGGTEGRVRLNLG